MAPNQSSGSAPSEALDHFLSLHDSGESLESFRDEKIDLRTDLESTKPQISLNLQTDTSSSNTMKFSSDTTFENDELDSTTEYPTVPIVEDIIVMNVDKADKTLTVPFQPDVNAGLPAKEIGTKVTISDSSRPTSFGKSLFGAIRPISVPPRVQTFETESSKFMQNQGKISPEESLLAHDASVQEALKKQQQDLLEQALKEEISVLQEEETWAVAEKQLAEDFSFAKNVDELLQSAGESDTQVTDPMAQDVYFEDSLTSEPISTNPATYEDKLNKLFTGMGIASSIPTSSGSPPPLENLSDSATIRPILSKRLPIFLQLQKSEFSPNLDRSENSPVSIDIPPATTSHQKRLPSKQLVPVTTIASDSTEGIIIRLHGDSKVADVLRYRIDEGRKSINPSSKDIPSATTSTARRRKTTPKRKIQSSSTRPSLATASSTISPKVIEFSPTPPLPSGILRIPGHAPEEPADLTLVHHDLSLPFLKDQGARVLNPNSAMSAEGKSTL